MQTVFVNEPAKPPPIPTSVADHSRPAPAQQSAPPSPWINVNLIVPDLSIKQWMQRMFKFGLALAVVYIALLIPLLVIAAIEKYVGITPGRPF